MERLQRILSSRGVASRRVAEEMIVAGRVSVNGETVTELGTKADPESDVIRVDGKVIRPQRRRYIMLNKPRGFITTTSDERERQTVMELVQTRERLYPVGRLDRDTEGLLLLTNDGDLANRVMHPRFGLEKEYHILSTERPTPETIDRVRRGVDIDGRRVTPNEFRIFRETRDGIVLTISLHEGMYHVVRRMMDAAGIPVERLTRVRVGPLMVAGIPVGAWRDLSLGEEQTLFEAVHMSLPEAEAAQRRSAEIKTERDRAASREDAARPRFTSRPGESHDRRPPFAAQGRPGPDRREERFARPEQRPDRPPRRDDRPTRPDDRTPHQDRQDRPARQPFQQATRAPRRFNPQRDLGQPRDGAPHEQNRQERRDGPAERPIRQDRPGDGQHDRRFTPAPERGEPHRDHTGRPIRHHADQNRDPHPGHREERRSGHEERGPRQPNQEQRVPSDQSGRRVNQRSSGQRDVRQGSRHDDRDRDRDRSRDQRGPGPRRDEGPADRRGQGPRRDDRGRPPRGSQDSPGRQDRRTGQQDRPWRPEDRPRDGAPRERRSDNGQRVRPTRQNDERRGAPARNDRPYPRPPAGNRDRRPGRGGQNDRGPRSGRPDGSDAV